MRAAAPPTSKIVYSTPGPSQVFRETIESLAVAFVLALLFKAFIAEAFVIPTGSMAPTLMGAHKDVRCEECGYQYQCGASAEYNPVGGRTSASVIGTTCPLCRKPQPIDEVGDPNHATFSGDRILVSKLAYVFSKPRRWDVIVFKFLDDARLNYIKRCIGRSNESIMIRDGDIFVRQDPTNPQSTTDAKIGASPTSGFEIARKPPHVLNAMLQIVNDSRYRSKSLVAAGYPDAWQPFPRGASRWKVASDPQKWSASIDSVPAGETHWLRYYHRVVDPAAWEYIESNKLLPTATPPDTSRLITDFTAYNAHYLVDESQIGTVDKERAREEIRRFHRKGLNTISHLRPLENDGIHWTGDLALDVDVTTTAGTQSLTLVIVEAGVEHECVIDLATGTAQAQVKMNKVAVPAFANGNNPLASVATAKTGVRAGGKHALRFSNVDECLVLWVDGRPVTWSPSALLDTESYLPYGRRNPVSTPTNPLDAAPLAIGVEGGGAVVERARVFRDIYYIAHGFGQSLFDYPDVSGTLRESVTDSVRNNYVATNHGGSVKQYLEKTSNDALNRNAVLSDVNQWGNSLLAKARRYSTFSTKDQQYFPMGDNSAASSDARSWPLHHTPERLMIGRAVMVFWPHYWNAPIPFLPNVQRMGLIR